MSEGHHATELNSANIHFWCTYFGREKTIESALRRLTESCLPQIDWRHCTMKRGLSCTPNCHIVFDQTDASWQEKFVVTSLHSLPIAVE